MKGIILAGGKATRLYPVTKGACKQLLPVYDKPMVYYPLSVLMLAGVREILIISTPHDIPRFRELLGSGKELGVRFEYKVQEEPRGIAESFLIAEEFIGREQVCLILGDNIFYGHDLTELLRKALAVKEGAVIFGYYVKDPGRYGVIEFDSRQRVVSIEEKPKTPKSKYAVCGLYFYDNRVVEIAKRIKPSPRGELEISDINNEYLKEQNLKLILMDRGYAWLDTGTHDALIDASMFIKAVEDRQGLKIGCIEEVAYRMGFIDRTQLAALARTISTEYGEYLKRISADER